MPGRTNLLEELTNCQLIERYRLDRDGILFLDNLLRDIISPKTNRSRSLSSIDKICLTLRYLASGGLQLNDGDIHEVSQPTVSRAVSLVIDALTSRDIVAQFIKFPMTNQELLVQTGEFYGMFNFPNVVGVIDCTHIKIKAPSIMEEDYVNRKGFHSINVQIIVNAFDEIIDVVARWPGSTHDSRVLHHSGMKTIFEEGHLPPGQFHLLGDSGYPCRRWLLTPYINPLAGSQTNYNRAHKQTRSKVERCIGQLKRRFSILHNEIRMSPSKACKITLACAVLHNICKKRRIPIPGEALEINYDDNDQDPNQNGNVPQIGLRYRDYVANTYF